MTGLNDDDERQRDLLFVGLRLFGSKSVPSDLGAGARGRPASA